MSNDNNNRPIIQASSYNNGKVFRICPKCNEEKNLEEFGLRNMGNDVIRNQSWCKECRNKYKK